MSLGKPVIATAWGGPLDYLDSSCGILVEPGSRLEIIDRFADAMAEMAGSELQRARMGRAGLDKIKREFDWEHKVDTMMALYRNAAIRAAGARQNTIANTANTNTP
jgi:glycosyltransferase involved in cell wall biosynthesis